MFVWCNTSNQHVWVCLKIGLTVPHMMSYMWHCYYGQWWLTWGTLWENESMLCVFIYITSLYVNISYGREIQFIVLSIYNAYDIQVKYNFARFFSTNLKIPNQIWGNVWCFPKYSSICHVKVMRHRKKVIQIYCIDFSHDKKIWFQNLCAGQKHVCVQRQSEEFSSNCLAHPSQQQVGPPESHKTWCIKLVAR